MIEVKTETDKLSSRQRFLLGEIEKVKAGVEGAGKVYVSTGNGIRSVQLSQESLEKETGELTKEITKNNAKLAEYGSALVSIYETLGKSEDAFKHFLKGFDLSEERINIAILGLRTYNKLLEESQKIAEGKRQDTLKSITDINKVTEEQFKAAKEEVEQKRRKIVLTTKESDVSKVLQKLRETDSDFAKREALVKRVEASEAALSPPPKSASNRAASEAKAIAEARSNEVFRARERELAELEKKNQIELQQYRAMLEDGIKSRGEFNNKEIELIRSNLDAKQKAAVAEIAELEKANAKRKEGAAKHEETLTKIRDLQSKINVIELERSAAEQEHLRTQGILVLGIKDYVDVIDGKLATVSKNLQLLKVDTSKVALDAKLPEPTFTEITPPPSPNELERQRFETGDARLRVEELRVQNAVNSGILTEAEGRQQILAVQREYRNVLIQSLELQKLGATEIEKIQLDEKIEQMRMMGVELNDAQRFMRGFGKETETVGDIFERFGQNVSNAFRNVSNLFDGLKKAVKDFFADLLGNSVQSLLRGTLGAILGGGAGGQGGGIGSILQSVKFPGGNTGIGGFGGVIGPGGTAVFNPNTFASSGGGTNFGGIIGSAFSGIGKLFGGGGSTGITAPPSSSGISLPSAVKDTLSTSDDTVLKSGGKFSNLFNFAAFKDIFKGIGFGLPKGAAKGNLASALPFLGTSLGIGLGGPSTLGKILGGVGGAALGIGLTAAPSIFAAGGALANPAIAGLFSNPITAVVGGALLIGAILLGRARQRRKDEEQSGVYLDQAYDGTRKLWEGVSRDEIDGSQAKQIFDQQIIPTFQAQISQLKTRSVRVSRLTNQVRDLRTNYAQFIQPAIDAQTERKRIAAERASIDQKLIPEFARGGVVPGFDRGYDSVLSRLRPGEMVLTQAQQSVIAATAGAQVFQVAGVPGVQPQAAFAGGGIVPTSTEPITLFLDVTLAMSDEDAEQIVVNGVSSSGGRNVVVKAVRHAQRFGEIK